MSDGGKVFELPKSRNTYPRVEYPGVKKPCNYRDCCLDVTIS